MNFFIEDPLILFLFGLVCIAVYFTFMIMYGSQREWFVRTPHEPSPKKTGVTK